MRAGAKFRGRAAAGPGSDLHTEAWGPARVGAPVS